MNINLNDVVRIKLTARGKQLHKDNWNAYGLSKEHKYEAPKEDAEGWSEWQLWHLMNEFGEYLYNGCEMPFETEIEIKKEK